MMAPFPAHPGGVGRVRLAAAPALPCPPPTSPSSPRASMLDIRCQNPGCSIKAPRPGGHLLGRSETLSANCPGSSRPQAGAWDPMAACCVD